MRIWVLFAFMSMMVTSAYSAEKTPTINVSGPTLIAFFSPVTQGEVDKNDETAEVLSDFQWHLGQVKQKLEKAGIAVHELYVRRFEVVTGKKKKVFKPGKIDVGYYFVKPGKLPKVEYGVMSDIDIVDAAAEYFGLPKVNSKQ